MGKRRFWASCWGDQSGQTSTEAGRGASDHIHSHTRGWDFGIDVHGYVSADGKEVFEIYTTGGSHDSSTRQLIARTEDGKIELATLLRDSEWRVA